MSDGEVKLAVFDCDGTIVDSQHSIIHSMQAAFTKYGLVKPPREAIKRVIGLPLLQAVAILSPEASPAQHENMRVAYSDSWQELRAGGGLPEPLYPGFLEALETLEAAGWLLGVATGKSHRGLVATLEQHGISERFVTLQTADRARGKPHPEMLLNAMSETGASVAHTVMIGDTTYDIEMSVNAKVRAIGVAWGYHEVNELLACGAEIVLDDFSQLAPTLA
jgi:phosphoglycolate phosphatase